MNTSWNTRLAAACASAFTTLAMLYGLAWLAGPTGAAADGVAASVHTGRGASGTARATLDARDRLGDLHLKPGNDLPKT